MKIIKFGNLIMTLETSKAFYSMNANMMTSWYPELQDQESFQNVSWNGGLHEWRDTHDERMLNGSLAVKICPKNCSAIGVSQASGQITPCPRPCVHIRCGALVTHTGDFVVAMTTLMFLSNRPICVVFWKVVYKCLVSLCFREINKWIQ